MTLIVAFAAPARADIVDILDWSATRFGADARGRYEHLIDLAVRQIAKEPSAVPSRERTEISAGLWAVHLRAVAGREVGDPRHIVFYRFDSTTIRIVRVLRESRDLAAALRES